jgi:hypothetical protein
VINELVIVKVPVLDKDVKDYFISKLFDFFGRCAFCIWIIGERST